jgi:hypothetical protein
MGTSLWSSRCYNRKHVLSLQQQTKRSSTACPAVLVARVMVARPQHSMSARVEYLLGEAALARPRPSMSAAVEYLHGPGQSTGQPGIYACALGTPSSTASVFVAPSSMMPGGVSMLQSSAAPSCGVTGQPGSHARLVRGDDDPPAATTSRTSNCYLGSDDDCYLGSLQKHYAVKRARTSCDSSTGQPGTGATVDLDPGGPYTAEARPAVDHDLTVVSEPQGSTIGSRSNSPRPRWSDIVDEADEEERYHQMLRTTFW